MVGDEHVIDHRSLARSPPWAGRGGEVDQGSKGAKGEVGLAKGSPFHPTHPGLARCNDFKDASKAARSSPTDSTGVVIPNTGTLIEYDAVALELVHPRLVWGNDLPARAQTAKAAQ